MTGETFGAMLKRHRIATPGQSKANRYSAATACLSQNALAHEAGIDPAYVNRLERGHIAPGRGVVLALAGALGLDDDETDRFLAVAGHAPIQDWQTRAEAAEAKLDLIRQTFDLPTDLLVFKSRSA